SELDVMTQQNAALVEQAAAASKSMGQRARDLNELVSFFTTADVSNQGTATASLDEDRGTATASAQNG
ncbi:MAG: chemotaxis protein, partial [Gammaproteobacteria bacterium]